MSKTFDPYAAVHLGIEAAGMVAQAQAVIWMRMAGMMGVWATDPSEMSLMIKEKTKAMQLSAEAATKAAMALKPPAEVLRAGLAPVARKTKANAARLKALGPKPL